MENGAGDHDAGEGALGKDISSMDSVRKLAAGRAGLSNGGRGVHATFQRQTGHRAFMLHAWVGLHALFDLSHGRDHLRVGGVTQASQRQVEAKHAIVRKLLPAMADSSTNARKAACPAGATPRQRAPVRDIIQMLPVSS
jgi:hypothetical protein